MSGYYLTLLIPMESARVYLLFTLHRELYLSALTVISHLPKVSVVL